MNVELNIGLEAQLHRSIPVFTAGLQEARSLEFALSKRPLRSCLFILPPFANPGPRLCTEHKAALFWYHSLLQACQ